LWDVQSLWHKICSKLLSQTVNPMSYFRNIGRGIKTTWKGMSLTMRHLWNARRNRMANDIQNHDYFDRQTGRVTVQFPHESIIVPDNGRYQLDVEMDDCIVCDKCAKICPVDCIEIEAIKSPEIISHASDGSPIRLYAAKFDIDMAKCCFCGLCTTVCPTECLTMTNEYDFSVADVHTLNFAFSKLAPEVADEKRKLYEHFIAEKQAAKPIEKKEETAATEPKKIAFKPKFGTNGNGAEKKVEEKPIEEKPVENKPKPVFKPKFTVQPLDTTVIQKAEEQKEQDKPKPTFKPKFTVNKATNGNGETTKTSIEIKPIESQAKPTFKPKFKLNPLDVSALEKQPEMDKSEEKPEVVAEEKPKTNTFRPKFKIPNKN
jgi:formate hydrogenlyase subunit 6/NADH:ubiquinone oxidoreductase subunit I